jgi:hypothetical protein
MLGRHGVGAHASRAHASRAHATHALLHGDLDLVQRHLWRLLRVLHGPRLQHPLRVLHDDGCTPHARSLQLRRVQVKFDGLHDSALDVARAHPLHGVFELGHGIG